MIERGILIGGHVLPGTERVIRDSRAWWAEPSADVYPRPGKIDRIVGHWTAGHPRTGPDAGVRLFQAMLGRKREDGTQMDVSVHFGGAWDGAIYQFADLANATIHVSRRINLRSVGFEAMWPGTTSQALKLKLPSLAPLTGHARGRSVKVYPPSSELLEGWRWLVGALTSADHPMLEIPMQRGSEDVPGIMEHMDIRGSSKVDAAGVLVGALGL